MLREAVYDTVCSYIDNMLPNRLRVTHITLSNIVLYNVRYMVESNHLPGYIMSHYLAFLLTVPLICLYPTPTPYLSLCLACSTL